MGKGVSLPADRGSDGREENKLLLKLSSNNTLCVLFFSATKVTKHRGTTPVFTARRYASAVLAVIVCLSVRLSVRSSVRLSVRPSVRLSVRHKSELYKDG